MRGIVFTETDMGSKMRARRAYGRVHAKLGVEFNEACKRYWWKVWVDARNLCRQMAYDTGSLYDSIRLIWELGPSAFHGITAYEVAVTAEGVQMSGFIMAGGIGINPKTGRIVDYAQAVHDGTRYMAERPFLTMAIQQNEGYLQKILETHTDRALGEWERD